MQVSMMWFARSILLTSSKLPKQLSILYSRTSFYAPVCDTVLVTATGYGGSTRSVPGYTESPVSSATNAT